MPESRHSTTAFGLARTLVDEFTAALLGQLDQPGQEMRTSPTSELPPRTTTRIAPPQAQLYAVQLHRNRMRVCFDVFLHHCTPEFRRQINETAARPIHAVAKLGDGDSYAVDRKPPFDARVASEIARVQERDEGPRPYFTNSMVTMYYDDGMRVEDNLELYPFFPSSRSRGHRSRYSELQNWVLAGYPPPPNPARSILNGGDEGHEPKRRARALGRIVPGLWICALRG